MLNCCSKRFCVVSLLSTNAISNYTFNTLIINAYLPTDYGTPDSNNALIEAVSELEGFLMCQSYDNLLVCGDLNVDFMRGGHNCRQLMMVQEYAIYSNRRPRGRMKTFAFSTWLSCRAKSSAV